MVEELGVLSRSEPDSALETSIPHPELAVKYPVSGRDLRGGAFAVYVEPLGGTMDDLAKLKLAGIEVRDGKIKKSDTLAALRVLAGIEHFEFGVNDEHGKTVHLMSPNLHFASTEPSDFDFLKDFIKKEDHPDFPTLGKLISQMDKDMDLMARNREGDVNTFIADPPLSFDADPEAVKSAALEAGVEER